jgi:CheY-like chemotaxis protein
MSRILVVDDDAMIRAALAEMLGRKGHEVVLAQNGTEALARQMEQPAEIMLTDIFMPGMEGLETIKRIRKMFPAVKIVAMTGRVTPDPGVDFLKVAQMLGARQTLRKPFTAAQLVAALAQISTLAPEDGVG